VASSNGRPTVDTALSVQGSKLSEEEQKTVARLLSDATYFPIEFKAWLKSFIEGAGITLPASAIIGAPTGAKTGLPAGCIVPWAGPTLPADCLPCDGAAVSRTEYPALFEALSTTWGAGDGTTTFNVPDYRDRALYGIGGNIALGPSGTDGVAYGSRRGANHYHDLSAVTSTAGQHGHSISGQTSDDGYHNHNLDGLTGYPFNINAGNQADVRSYLEQRGNTYTQSGGVHHHSFSGGTDNKGDHTHQVNGQTTGAGVLNQPCYAGVRYAISTGK
jgi:microcystin-dependent protein